MSTFFDQKLRVLLCENCGGPVQCLSSGGQAQCSYCGAVSVIAARNDHARSHARMEEAERLLILRQQEGRLLQAPDSLHSLLQQGQLDGEREPLARKLWQDTRKELESQITGELEEKFYFLTFMLVEAWKETPRQTQIRALLETALSVIDDPNYRSQFHGMMARRAAQLKEFEAAEYWLSLCDVASDDIFVDSDFRHAVARFAGDRGVYSLVLQALGTQISDVPVSSAHVNAFSRLRIEALEKTGQGALASQQRAFWEAKTQEQKVQADSHSFWANPVGAIVRLIFVGGFVVGTAWGVYSLVADFF